MSQVRVFGDLVSQPTRAVLIFCKVANVPHVYEKTIIGKGDNKKPEYLKVNPLGTVPGMQDSNGVCSSDSNAMFRYISRAYKVDEHWYPWTDLTKMVKVDDYLHWQHLNLRNVCGGYARAAFVYPMRLGIPATKEGVAEAESKVSPILDTFEKVWLASGNKEFLANDKISVADISACCELEQPSMAGLDVRKDREVLTSYMARVRQTLQPHYDEMHEKLYYLKEKFGHPLYELPPKGK